MTPACPAAAQTVCCFANSVVVTRWLIQDELFVMNTQCDNCLMAWLIFIEDVACIFRCAGDLTGSPMLEEIGALLTCAADLSYCSICACMQARARGPVSAFPPPLLTPPRAAAPRRRSTS